MNLTELKQKPIPELLAMAEQMGLENMARSRKQDIINLSGGNQQKVILGRWLSEQGVKVLVIDEPTRGIDIGAKAEIYEILYGLAAEGMAIIVISS